MMTQEENELMTRVGAGTPAGGNAAALLVAGGVYRPVTGQAAPTKVTLLAEDFVLFRDGERQAGLGRAALFPSRHVVGVRAGRRERHSLLLPWLALGCARQLPGSAGGAGG